MGSGFSRKRVYQCSYGRASAYVGGQNLLTSDVIYHEHLVQRDLRLQTRQRSTQTEVDAAPEAQVPIRLTLDMEPIGIGELGLITIRRGDPGKQDLTSSYTLIAHRRLGHRPARLEFDRRVVAQGLFKCAGHQVAIGTQTFQ